MRTFTDNEPLTDAEIDRHVFRLYGLTRDEAHMMEAERSTDRSVLLRLQPVTQ